VTKSGQFRVQTVKPANLCFPSRNGRCRRPLCRRVGVANAAVPLKRRPFRQLFSADLITDISRDSYRPSWKDSSESGRTCRFYRRRVRARSSFPDSMAAPSGAERRSTPGAASIREWKRDPWILTMVETGNEAPLKSGRQIYNQICAACHASTARATERAYPTLVNIGQKLKRPEILQLLDSGRGNMPAVAFLSKPQKESVRTCCSTGTPRRQQTARPSPTRKGSF